MFVTCIYFILQKEVIISRKENRPRYVSEQPKAKIDLLETLILLCKKHHKIIDNKDLEKVYNNIETILSHSDIQKWVKWVKKKPYDFSISMAQKKKR